MLNCFLIGIRAQVLITGLLVDNLFTEKKQGVEGDRDFRAYIKDLLDQFNRFIIKVFIVYGYVHI